MTYFYLLYHWMKDQLPGRLKKKLQIKAREMKEYTLINKAVNALCLEEAFQMCAVSHLNKNNVC